MSLRDVGVKYGIHGIERSMRQIDQFGGKFSALSRRVDTGIARQNRSWRAWAGGITKYAAIAGGALTGLAAASVLLPKKLAETRKDLTGTYHDLRALGKTSEDLAKIEQHLMNYTDMFSGAKTAQLARGLYPMISATSDLSTAQQAAMTTAGALMGKLTTLNALESSEYLTKWMGGYRGFIKGDIVQATQRFAAQTATAVNLANTNGRRVMAAMENSQAILSQLGWKPRTQIAAWSALTELGSGEKAGTILSQLSGKAGIGYAKMMAPLEAAWIQGADRLTGRAKRRALENNKEVLRDYQGKGAELWAKQPILYLQRMKRAVGEHKKLSKNWFSVLQSGFQEDPAKGLLSFISKLEKFTELERKLANVSWDSSKKRAAALDQDLAAIKGRYGNRYDNLMQTIGKVFEPTYGKFYNWLGGEFMGARGQITNRMSALQGAVTAFSTSMAGSFQRALKIDPALSQGLQRVVNLLDKPNPAKWAQVGESIGKLAGTKFSGLTNSLDSVAASLKTIAKTAGMVNSALGLMQSAFGAYTKDFLPGVTRQMGAALRETGGSWIGLGSTGRAARDFLATGRTVAQRQAMLGRVPPKGGADARTLPAPGPERWDVIPRYVPIVPPGYELTKSGQQRDQPPLVVNPKIQNDIRVTLDGREIYRSVLEQEQVERDRAGFGWADRSP